MSCDDSCDAIEIEPDWKELKSFECSSNESIYKRWEVHQILLHCVHVH